MKNVITVWKELLANRERIFRLARYEQRAKNSGTRAIPPTPCG